VTAESCLPALKDEPGAHLNHAAAADAGDYPTQSVGRAAIPCVGDCGAGRKAPRIRARVLEIIRSESIAEISKTELHSQLNLAHGRLIQQARDDAGGGRADGRAGGAKVRMVQSIEHLDPELMLEAFLEPRVFDD